MAKFKVEVDLDWMDSETTIDDEIRDEVIRGAKDYLLEKTTDEIQKKLDAEIGKKLVEASEKVEEIVDGFLESRWKQLLKMRRRTQSRRLLKPLNRH